MWVCGKEFIFKTYFFEPFALAFLLGAALPPQMGLASRAPLNSQLMSQPNKVAYLLPFSLFCNYSLLIYTFNEDRLVIKRCSDWDADEQTIMTNPYQGET